MSRYQTLGYEQRDAIAWVTLNRPEALNAIDLQMMEEIGDCWRMLRDDDSVRVIVLTGAGDRSFSTGLDRNATSLEHPRAGGPNDIGQRGGTPLHLNDLGDHLPPKTAGDLWKPVIAAVNGMACGGAFYLLGEVEFIIAAEHATFFDPHHTYGMSAVLEPMLMLQRMPLGEVMRMTLMGSHERLSARRAREIGLVQEVVPAAEPRKAAHRAATAIAGHPPLAVQTTVRAIWHAQHAGLRHALDVAKPLVMLGSSEETMAEGQRRFTSGERIDWRLR